MSNEIKNVNGVAIQVPTESHFYVKLPDQMFAQPVYIYLDTTSRRMWVDYTEEVGGAMPIRVWNGDIERFRVPSSITPAAALYVMERLAELSDRLLTADDDRYEIEHEVEHLIDSHSDTFDYVIDSVDDIEDNVSDVFEYASLTEAYEAFRLWYKSNNALFLLDEDDFTLWIRDSYDDSVDNVPSDAPGWVKDLF